MLTRMQLLLIINKGTLEIFCSVLGSTQYAPIPMNIAFHCFLSCFMCLLSPSCKRVKTAHSCIFFWVRYKALFLCSSVCKTFLGFSPCLSQCTLFHTLRVCFRNYYNDFHVRYMAAYRSFPCQAVNGISVN